MKTDQQALNTDPGNLPEGAARPRLVFDDHNAEYLLQKRACLTDTRQPMRWPAAAWIGRKGGL